MKNPVFSQLSFHLRNPLTLFITAVFVFLLSISIKFNPETTAIMRYAIPYAKGVTLDGFSAGVVFFLIWNYILIAFFGYSLTFPFYKTLSKTALPLKLAASFFVGYIGSLGVIRIFSLIVTFQDIYLPTILFLILIAVINLRKNIKAFLQAQFGTIGQMTGTLGKSFFIILLLAFLVFAALMLQITQGYYNWVGHGPTEYAAFLDYLHNLNPVHFPIILQHYDEPLFHYFVTMPLISRGAKFDAVLPWWMTLGMIKISAAMFLFLMFRRLKIGKVLSSVFALFLMIGTTSFLLCRYYVLFDSLNPLFFVAHSGRIVGVCLILMLVIDHIYRDSKESCLPAVFFIFTGLGISATSIANSMWLLTFIIILFLTQIMASRKSKEAGLAIIFLSIISSVLMYGLPFDQMAMYYVRAGLVVFNFVLLASWIIARVALFLRQEFPQVKRIRRSYALKLICLFLSVVLGSTLLGNVLTSKDLSTQLAEGLNPLAGKIEVFLLKEVGIVGDMSLGDYRITKGGEESMAFRHEYEYERGAGYFIGYFGAFLMMCMLFWSFYFRERKTISYLKRDELIFDLFTFLVFSIPLIFLVVSFVNTGITFVKTRFLEVPLYLCTVFFFYACTRALHKRALVMLGFLTVLFCVVPFLATERLKQIVENFRLFITLVP